MRTECEGLGAAACRRRCKPAVIRTLAYVVSDCRVDAAGFVGHQTLRIRRGDRDPVTVAEFSGPTPIPDPAGLCRLYGESRVGAASAVAGPLQRLGVSPDGSQVVFEVTDDHSFFPLTAVPPEAQGMFVVGADGRGLRRLGPASREPSFRITPSPEGGGDFDVSTGSLVPFSPDRRWIAFTDRGPGPAGEEAVQVVALELATGRRTQLTHLPAGTSPYLSIPVTCCPKFVDNHTVVFSTFIDPEGPNPEGSQLAFTVRLDGTRFTRVPTPVAEPGSRVIPSFQVTNLGTNLVELSRPGTPENPAPGSPGIIEVFLVDGRRLLQLTNFRRVDTASAFLAADRRRAFFNASADPLGTNPSGDCQLFSIGTLGTRLRQITHFDSGAATPIQFGCAGTRPPGCSVREALQDPVTRSIVLYSSCDPFGTNPHGGQLFAMRSNGSGLRQLTSARGFAVDPDGTVRAELPGPFAYSTVPR
jgi:hypothetical protein